MSSLCTICLKLKKKKNVELIKCVEFEFTSLNREQK